MGILWPNVDPKLSLESFWMNFLKFMESLRCKNWNLTFFGETLKNFGKTQKQSLLNRWKKSVKNYLKLQDAKNIFQAVEIAEKSRRFPGTPSLES